MSETVILMIEDDPHIMKINRTILAKQGYRLLEAETLRDGRAVLEKESPDIIVLDIQLPDGSGLDFCAWVRLQRSTPILILTAFGESGDIVKGFGTGCDDYLAKPYDPNVLAARVEGLLRRSRQAETLTRGALTLSIVRQQAFAGDEELGLTRTQFIMLHYFIRNEGRVVHTDQLYEQVWGRPMADDAAAVKTAVSRLREKIGPAGFQIEAVRGSGYRFVESDE